MGQNKRDPEREKLPNLLTPPRPSSSENILPNSQLDLLLRTQDTAFTGLRFFTAVRRMPPALPAAIRRAFLLEELSYPPASDPLSSGVGLSETSFSPDSSRFIKFPPTHRNIPMNQVFFNEARVALEASKRISSPSSALRKKAKLDQIAGPDPRAYDVHILPLHDHVNHLPRDRITFLI